MSIKQLNKVSPFIANFMIIVAIYFVLKVTICDIKDIKERILTLFEYKLWAEFHIFAFSDFCVCYQI